jgi:hypothetical protein
MINKRLQKPRRLNLKCMPAVNNANKTNGNIIRSRLFQIRTVYENLTF